MNELAQDGGGVSRFAERAGVLLSSLAARSRALCARKVFIAAALFVATLAAPLNAAQMPKISGQSLTDKTVDFPSACDGSPCVLVIGYSHGSQSEVKAWTDRLSHVSGHLAVYSIAVLEDAPRFVRGMAVHGMKSGTPVAQRDHFVVVTEGEADLKRITGFQKSDEAYLVLLDKKGGVAWTTHGPISDAALSDFNQKLSSAQAD